MPRGGGEQVVQHLLDALTVGHNPWLVKRKVDQDDVSAAPALERAPSPIHQDSNIGGLGRHRQRARVDAARIQQVADQDAHVIGLREMMR